MYWIVVIAGFFLMRYKETNGHLPFLAAKKDPYASDDETPSKNSSRVLAGTSHEKSADAGVGVHAVPATTPIPE